MSQDAGGARLTPAMRRFLIVVVAVVALGLVAAALWTWGAPGHSAPSADGTASSSLPAAAPTGTASPSDSAAATTKSKNGGASASARSDAASAGPDATASSGASSAPSGSPEPTVFSAAPTIAAPSGSAGPTGKAVPQAGSEAQPGTAPTQKAQPRPTAPAKLLTSVPRSSTRKGALVSGYPTRVMGPIAGSAITSSASTSAKTTQAKKPITRTQVSLVAHTSTSRAKVAAHYRSKWAELGLTPGGTPSTDGSLTFSGPTGSVTLAFPASATDTRYTLFGSFITK